MSVTATTTVTWQLVVDAEPDLLRLEAETRWMAKHAGRNACANEIWYRFIKPQIYGMVGFGRGYPRTQDFDYGRDENGMLLAVWASDPRFVAWCDAREKARPPATTDAERMLRSMEAHDATWRHLYDLLPNCRHEGDCRG